MPIVYEDSYFLQYHKYRVFLKNIHTYYYISCIFCVAPKKDHVESPRHWIGIDLRPPAEIGVNRDRGVTADGDAQGHKPSDISENILYIGIYISFQISTVLKDPLTIIVFYNCFINSILKK